MGPNINHRGNSWQKLTTFVAFVGRFDGVFLDRLPRCPKVIRIECRGLQMNNRWSPGERKSIISAITALPATQGSFHQGGTFPFNVPPSESVPSSELSETRQSDLVKLFEFLADGIRWKILMGFLRQGEMHVSAMCEIFQQSQPAVCHDRALLRSPGIIAQRRIGKHNGYSVCQDRFRPLMGQLFFNNERSSTWRIPVQVVCCDTERQAGIIRS